MANITKLNKVFNFIELNYQNISNQIIIWLSSAYQKSGILFNSASPYGQILEVVKEMFLQNILYLKNFVRQIDIEQAGTKRMIYNIARISGHNPSRAISAKGTLKFKLKQGIDINSKVAGGKVTIYDDTSIKNKSNSLFYVLKVGVDKNIYSLTPGCQFFVNVVQGKYESQNFTGDGTSTQSFQVNVSSNSMIDNFDVQVLLNGRNLTIKDHLYDMLKDEYACFLRTGFNGGLDVYFGNSVNGIIPPNGSLIEVKYLLTNGLQGNILNNKVNDFTFIGDLYDDDGNEIQVNQIFDVFVDTDIKFASDGESVEYTKTIIPYVSRNFVLATPAQFIYHLRKLNIFSSVNAFNTLDMVKIDIDSDGTLDNININEMYLNLIPRITDYFSNDVNYFNVPFDAFFLDQVEKDRIISYIKKQGILSITSTIKIIDPKIKRFIINIFMTKFEGSNDDNIKEQIITVLSDFFSTYDRHDRIVKADLIGQLKTIDGIDSLNIEFVGEQNENYHRDGAVLSSSTKPVLETTYAANSSSVNVNVNSYVSVTQNNIDNKNLNNSANQSSSSNNNLYRNNLSNPESAILGVNTGTENISVGDSTIVAYSNTQYDSKKMINIDPVLGDIIIEKNDLIVLRGGWPNRNGVYFNENPRSTDGFSTINIIPKGITYKK
jgi:hypothetical protein